MTEINKALNRSNCHNSRGWLSSSQCLWRNSINLIYSWIEYWINLKLESVYESQQFWREMYECMYELTREERLASLMSESVQNKDRWIWSQSARRFLHSSGVDEARSTAAVWRAPRELLRTISHFNLSSPLRSSPHCSPIRYVRHV